MQRHVFATTDPRAQLQSFQPIQALDTLVVDRPALAARKHLDQHIAESRSDLRDLADPSPQHRLVFGRILPVARRP